MLAMESGAKDIRLELSAVCAYHITAAENSRELTGVSCVCLRRFPTPLQASNKDDVYVGRIRRDISRSDNRGLDLFVCGDQIKKGAALNAVQIAELLLKKH